jgi:plastocyanin
MHRMNAVLALTFMLLAGCGNGSTTTPPSNGGGNGGTTPPPPPAPPPASANVVAGETTNTFAPSSVNVARNGTVTWTFGYLQHNVTFSSAGAPANIPNSTDTQVSRTFATAGTFNYTCTLHPGMNGTVVVVE